MHIPFFNKPLFKTNLLVEIKKNKIETFLEEILSHLSSRDNLNALYCFMVNGIVVIKYSVCQERERAREKERESERERQRERERLRETRNRNISSTIYRCDVNLPLSSDLTVSVEEDEDLASRRISTGDSGPNQTLPLCCSRHLHYAIMPRHEHDSGETSPTIR